MRTTLLAMAIALVTVGCQPKQDKVKPGGTEPAAGIEVKAPGVDVEVKPGEGVEVKAPGTEVEVAPKEGEAKAEAEPQ
jgi:hypothetical protein